MLPKEKRIRNSRDFKRIYQKGSFFSVGVTTIHCLKNRLSFSRVGTVINKKAEPKATKRNKIKRRFREASRRLYADIPNGYDVIIMIKGPARDADFPRIEKELAESFKRIGKE